MQDAARTIPSRSPGWLAEPLGRGGALRLALGQVPEGEDLVIATNGDVITNLKLSPLVAAHRARKMLATIYLTPFVSPYGIVETDGDDRVTQFREKPELPYWINGGIYVLRSEEHTSEIQSQSKLVSRLLLHK